MCVLKDFYLKFLCGILFACAAPSASAFGQDGQIILSVFIPIIAFVIVIVIVRLCWEWNTESHQDPYKESNSRLTFLEIQKECFLEAPKSLGTFVRIGDALRYPSTHLDHNPFFLDDKNNNFPVFRDSSFVCPQKHQHARQINMQKTETRSNSEQLIFSTLRKSSDCYQRNDRMTSRCFDDIRILKDDRKLSLGQDRNTEIHRTSFVKSTENRNCSRRKVNRRQRRRDLMLKRRKNDTVIKMDWARSSVMSKRGWARSSMRNNARPYRLKSSSIDVVDKWNRLENNFELFEVSQWNGRNNFRKLTNVDSNRRGSSQHQALKSDRHAARRSSSLKTKSKPLKSCLKTTTSNRKPSKRVRFYIGGLRKPSQRRISVNKNKKVIIVNKPSSKNVMKIERKQSVKSGSVLVEPVSRERSLHGSQRFGGNKPQPFIKTTNKKRDPLSSYCNSRNENPDPYHGNDLQTNHNGNGIYNNTQQFSSSGRMRLSEIQLSPEIDPVLAHQSNYNTRPRDTSDGFLCTPVYRRNQNCFQNHKEKPQNLKSESNSISVFLTEESSFVLPRESYIIHDSISFGREG